MTPPRKVIDPRGTLPEIHFEMQRSTDEGFMTREQMFIMQRGERMGTCDIVYEMRPRAQIAHFDGIEVRSVKRGRGIGLASYVLAIEQAHARGYDFETQNYELTQHSKKVWERLAALGVAQVIEPFVPSPRRAERFLGKYRIPVYGS